MITRAPQLTLGLEAHCSWVRRSCLEAPSACRTPAPSRHSATMRFRRPERRPAPSFSGKPCAKIAINWLVRSRNIFLEWSLLRFFFVRANDLDPDGHGRPDHAFLTDAL